MDYLKCSFGMWYIAGFTGNSPSVDQHCYSWSRITTLKIIFYFHDIKCVLANDHEISNQTFIKEMI